MSQPVRLWTESAVQLRHDRRTQYRIGTTVADPSQWQAVFGTEFDHCDQFEIVYRAQTLDEARVQQHLGWVKANIPTIDSAAFSQRTPSNFRCAVYLALKIWRLRNITISWESNVSRT